MPTTRLGAIVDDVQMQTVLGYIDAGRSEGAAVLAGGERAREESGGYYVQPTVFADVRPRHADRARGNLRPGARRDHASRTRRKRCASATASTTASPPRSGRATSRKAHRIARSLRAGMVYVNCYDADDITVPFGGFKQSGIGRDKSLHAFDKYTELKTTWIDLTAMSGYSNVTFDEIEVGATAASSASLSQTEVEALLLVSGDVVPFHAETGTDFDPDESERGCGRRRAPSSPGLLERRLPGPGTRIVSQQLEFAGRIRVGDRRRRRR